MSTAITNSGSIGNTTTQQGPSIFVTSLYAIPDTFSVDVMPGHVIGFNVITSSLAIVTGTPTLQLNNNEVAYYVGYNPESSNDLQFVYTVQAKDQSYDLAVTGLNLTNGATITSALDPSGTLGSELTIPKAEVGLQVNIPPVSSATVQQEVAGLYAAVYGRVVDSVGLTYWGSFTASLTGASNNPNSPVSSNAVTSLGQKITLAEDTYYSQHYQGLNDSDFVNALYMNIGGTNAESQSAISYWVNALQTLEQSGLNSENSRAALAGQFVQALLTTDLNQWYGILDSNQMALAVHRQAEVHNKLDVSLAYMTASAGLGGSILNAHAVGDAAFQAEVRLLSSVTADPSTVTTALAGIANAVGHQDLSFIL